MPSPLPQPGAANRMGAPPTGLRVTLHHSEEGVATDAHLSVCECGAEADVLWVQACEHHQESICREGAAASKGRTSGKDWKARSGGPVIRGTWHGPATESHGVGREGPAVAVVGVLLGAVQATALGHKHHLLAKLPPNRTTVSCNPVWQGTVLLGCNRLPKYILTIRHAGRLPKFDMHLQLRPPVPVGASFLFLRNSSPKSASCDNLGQPRVLGTVPRWYILHYDGQNADRDGM